MRAFLIWVYWLRRVLFRVSPKRSERWFRERSNSVLFGWVLGLIGPGLIFDLLESKESSFLGVLVPEVGVNGALLSIVGAVEEGGLF